MYVYNSTKNFSLQGKGRMTTYWLLGEKNSETTSAEVTEVSASSLEATSQEQLLSQKGNTPSIGTIQGSPFMREFSAS